MTRDDHIANMITFVWYALGANLLPPGETDFVLCMYDLIDEAIADEVRRFPSLFEQSQKVSVN